ncbi:MAG TPA: hypothetical protein VFL90_14400, partial [Methylomirabilota bacterium]|nr:hypothetical protein [Methylomirabilota bacterium]
MIVDVAFDAPVDHPFSYRVPAGWTPAVGQRVLAPLGGARRVGIVLALREGDERVLKSLLAPAEPAPALDVAGLGLARWIAAESLSSVGSTCAALLPPVEQGTATRPGSSRGRSPLDRSVTTPEPAAGVATAPSGVELLVGAGREKRLLEQV